MLNRMKESGLRPCAMEREMKKTIRVSGLLLVSVVLAYAALAAGCASAAGPPTTAARGNKSAPSRVAAHAKSGHRATATSRAPAAPADVSSTPVVRAGLDPALDRDPFRSTYIPAAAPVTAIVNASMLTGTGVQLEHATIVVDQGKIVAVGSDVTPPAGAIIVDGTGKWVTPGIIDAHSHLGVFPSPSVDSLADGNEKVDPNVAQVWAEHSVWPQDPNFSRARAGGVTTLLILPGSSNLFGGRSVTLKNVPARTTQEMKFPGAPYSLKMACGENPKRNYGAKGRSPATRMGNIAVFRSAALQAVLDDVRTYAANRSAYDRGEMRELRLSRIELEALAPVAQGRMPLVVNVDRAADIHQVLQLAREEKLKLILEGATEGWLVADEIAAAHVPVVLNALADLPSSFDKLASTLDNAARLHAAGVMIVIEGDRAGQYARQVRFNAGNAVAHGLPYDAALAAVTVNAARIWGQNSFGALAVGQEADLVIWSGDPFEPLTQPQVVFIRGIEQPLESRHLQLRDRYRDIIEKTASPYYRQ